MSINAHLTTLLAVGARQDSPLYKKILRSKLAVLAGKFDVAKSDVAKIPKKAPGFLK